MGSVAYTGTLTSRQERILFALCREYIVTGRPVSSSRLSRTQGLTWSSATIRNELGALERAGFLQQPHHSSGRTPTATGMGAYVASLGALSEPPSDIRRAVDLAFADRVRRPSGLRPAARVLSRMGGCVAVAFLGEGRRGVIRKLDLVPLGADGALVAMGLEDGTTTTKTIGHGSELLGGTDSVAFGALGERLAWLCVGKTLEEARTHLTRLQGDEEARLDRMLGAALRIGLWMCSAAALDPLWLQVAGRRLLANSAPLAAEAARRGLAEVLGLLEDYHRLAAVLCQLLPEPGDGAGHGRDGSVARAVTLPHPAVARVGTLTGTSRALVLTGMSLVGCRVQGNDDGSHTGAIALLGPDRMDYERVIPLVEYAAQALASRTTP